MFKFSRGRRALFRLTLLAPGLMGLTACGEIRPPQAGMLQATIPPAIDRPCDRPAKPATPTIGDLAAFSIAQEGAIDKCDTKRAAAVSIIRMQNETSKRLAASVRPKQFWEFWR